MNRDVALAQVSTLREWASAWERDNEVDPRPGQAEVWFALERAARSIERAVGVESPEESKLPIPEPVTELRGDSEPETDTLR